MTGRYARTAGFTLVELLVVVLVIGILVSLALPYHLSTLKDGRHRTANVNTKAVATAIQSLYVRAGGFSYEVATTEDLERELGGTAPINPCTGGKVLGTDYVIDLEPGQARVVAAPGESGCQPSGLVEIILRSNS